jgi:dTDP-4-amino-4,6-dideoxygalactose transaminase
MSDAANPVETSKVQSATWDRTTTLPERAGESATAARSTFLPFHRPWIDEAEIAEVVDTLRSGWLTMGPKTLQFEEQFATYVGARFAVALNSCTSALHLALDALGIRPDDEVITSVYTFTATAAVTLHLGGRPVLVDIQPDTMTMDPEQVAAKITPRTKAIVPVHMAGVPCDMDPLLELASKHGLRIVEDAAHTLPAHYKSRSIGSISDMTAFSFYATKNITTGEGGMITTDSDEYADRLRVRRLHGISRDAWKRYTSEGSWYYEVEYPGYKYNPTDINSALGLQQLRRADRFHAVRAYYASLYQLGLSDVPEITLPEPPPWGTHSWHLYVIQLNLDQLTIDRDAFMRLLREENIGASVHFIPLHLHPYYRERFGYRPTDFPNALQAYRRAISLPLYPRMSEGDVWDVIRAVRRIVERHRSRRQT